MSFGPIEATIGDPDILVYDAQPDGHRENCVTLFARLTGGTALIAPVKAARKRLLAAPSLVITTYETQPAAFLLILVVRAMLGRRSAVIFMRAHLPRARMLHRAFHRAAIALVNRLRAVLPLTLVPLPAKARASRFVAIADPESWDLGPEEVAAPATALSEQALAFAAGRPILLVTGYIERNRGIEFLRDIYARRDGLIDSLVPVLGGMLAPDVRDSAAELQALGALVVDRYLSRSEMMSLYAAATAAWCCYVPERDISSGIFGRAIQFGVAPVVRRGSVLHGFSAQIGNAVPIDFGKVEDAARRLRTGVTRSPPRIEGSRDTRAAIRALLIDHFEAATAN